MAFTFREFNTQPATEGEYIWRMKEALVAAGAMTVVRSGDATTVSQVGDVHSPGGPYGGSLDITDAWFEMQQPATVTPRRSILLQKTSTAGAWRIWYSSGDTYKSGVGDSFTFSTPDVTLTDATAAFTAGDVGQYVQITGATSPANNGYFPVTAQGGTTLTFTNPLGVAEAFTGTWKLIKSDGFKWGVTGVGTTPGISLVGGTTYRMTASAGAFVAGDVGKTLRITGATSPGNNGDFVVTAQTATTLDYTNAAGVAEAYTGNYYLSRDATASVRSVASDEQGLLNTPSGTTGWLPTVNRSYRMGVIIGGLAEGFSFMSFTWSNTPTLSTQGLNSLLALDVLDQAHAYDPDPAVLLTQLASTGNTAFEAASTIVSTATPTNTQSWAVGWYAKKQAGETFAVYGPTTMGLEEGFIGTLTNSLTRVSIRPYDLAFPELPTWYARGGPAYTTQRGRKGKSRIFRSTPPMLGGFRPNNTRTRMAFLLMSIPWDGITIPTFG
jgi:hypothetical protein